MAKIEWDATGEHLYETGVRNGVLYPRSSSGAYTSGVAWNGLTSVSESPSGAEASPLWADDIKYLNLISTEDFSATVEAYTYPEAFEACDGSASIATGVVIGQQARQSFGMSYRTVVGNDVEGNDLGYKIHCIYGATAAPSEKAYETINDSPDAITFSWELSTIPVNVNGKKPTASLTINSTKADPAKLAALEAVLYGVDAEAFSSTATYKVGDAVTYTSGSPEATKTYVLKAEDYEPGEFDEDDWIEVTNPGPRLPLPDEIAQIMG